jgi:hypothetical protein
MLALMHVNSTTEQKSDDVIGRIQELLKQVKDESLKEKVVEQIEKHSQNSAQLIKIEERLKTKLGE